MTDVIPDAISQIATRLFQEVQAAANGSPPSLGVLPLAPTSSIGLPSKAGLSPTAMPEPVNTPLSRAPGRGMTTELPFREHLPSVPNDPHLMPPFSSLAEFGTEAGTISDSPLSLARSPEAGARGQSQDGFEGLRQFVGKVQQTQYRSSPGLCTEHPFVPLAHATPRGTERINGSASSLDVSSIRRDFPILHQHVHGKPLVWLDNAATTQKPQSVIDAISNFYARDNSNIHRAAHSLAARSTDAFEGAREKVRQFLGAGSVDEIIFVRGTTEGINLITQTYGRKFLQPGDEIVLSTLEHHANIVPWQAIAKEKGAVLQIIPVNDRGEVMLEDYQSLLGPRTKVVALTHASNSLGTVLPIGEMIQMAKRYHARVLIDGAQTVAHLPVNVQQLDCDFFVFSGHKIFGPTGIGAVFAKSELLEIMPPWQGGGNMIRNVTFEETTYAAPPAKFEAGTPNIADAVGLGAALDYVTRLGLPNIAQYEHELLEYGTERLASIDGLRLVGTAREKVGVLSFVLPGKKTEEIGKLLDLEGIAVRAGHHCSQPSLRRFGLESTVRPSLAFYNTKDEIDRLVDAVRRIQQR